MANDDGVQDYDPVTVRRTREWESWLEVHAEGLSLDNYGDRLELARLLVREGATVNPPQEVNRAR